MIDKNKLMYDLSLIYAQEILENRPEEKDGINEMNGLLLSAFNDAYSYYSLEFGLTDK